MTRLEVVNDAAWLKGRGLVVGPPCRVGRPCSAGIVCRCRSRRASIAKPDRHAKPTKIAPISSSDERPRRVGCPLRFLRFLVTSPQKSRASDAKPANPARVMSTLKTTEAGPRRSSAASGPCCADAPITASSMKAVVSANPSASLPDGGVRRFGARVAVALDDACIFNTLRAVSVTGRKEAEAVPAGTELSAFGSGQQPGRYHRKQAATTAE